MRSLVFWAACDCTCWPLTALHGMGRCGACGKTPTKFCQAPEDGKAYQL